MESLAAPTPDEFRALIAGGKLAPASLETRVVLGNMCLAGFIGECSSLGYEESLARAADDA
jgi:hypothetical protein